jgi:hypothetical protein
VPVSADFQSLCAALGLEAARGGHLRRAMHDDGECLTHLVDLSNLPATEGQTPEIDAIWLARDGIEPLALGRLLDRLERHSHRRPEALIGRREIEPALKNLLEARCARVEYKAELPVAARRPSRIS